MKIATIKEIEAKVRKIMYEVASFCFLLTFVPTTLPQIKEVNLLFIPIYVPIVLLISPFVTYLIKSQLVRLMEVNNWAEKKDLIEYKTIVRVLRVGLLLNFVLILQMSIISVFPKVMQIQLNHVPLWIPFLVSNCFPVYLFYNKYIFSNSDEVLE